MSTNAAELVAPVVPINQPMEEASEAASVAAKAARATKRANKAKKAVKTKAAAVTRIKGPKRSRAEKFLSSAELQAEFVKKYPVCTGKFRKTTGNMPTPSHSVQCQVTLPDGSVEYVYKQDVFQVNRKKAAGKTARARRPAAAKKAAKKSK